MDILEKHLMEKIDDNKKSELEDIIINERIISVFQPIISLRDGSVFGYEALSRIQGNSGIKTSEELFHIAAYYEKLWDLEQLCRKYALKKMYENSKLLADKKLFLNVSPLIIYDKKFQAGFTKEYLRRYHINPAQIVFELTERDSSANMNGFSIAVEHYKKQQYEIAIDDLGSGYSSLNLICELQPHFVKLDMQLVREVQKNSSKLALLKSLKEFSTMTNMKLIAEGIETKEELETLISIGIHYGQGYYLGRPNVHMIPIKDDVIKNIKECNIKKHNITNHGMNHSYIKHISTNVLTVQETISVEQVLSYFEENPLFPGICITHFGKVKGILTKEKLQRILSGRYGFSLHQNKDVAAIMDRDFLEVDAYTPISTVSAIAMDRSEGSLYDFVVVTEAGQYYGIVTIKDLLIKSTEISVSTAKASNPLTGLPGNLVINQEISKLVEQNIEYTVMYIDMDNFKAFNDVYGFERGDEVIRIMAQVLREKVGESGFIGHVGGDDFVVILYHNEYQLLFEQITQQFEKRTRELYSENDRERGYIEAENRHGKKEQFPLLSITIALTTDKEKKYFSQYELVEELAIRKKLAKQK